MQSTIRKRLDELQARLLGDASRDALWDAFFRQVDTWPAERRARLQALWDNPARMSPAERAEFDALILADPEATRLFEGVTRLAHLEYCAQNGAVYGKVNPYDPT